MITKNIKKLIVAVALTLAVTFTTGVSDSVLHTDFVPSANAGCMGTGSSGGGGC